MRTQTIEHESIKSNVTNYKHWQRLIFMLLFAVLLHLAGAVMWVLCILQFVFSVFTGKDNDNLRYLGATIAQYIQQLLHYLSYGSDSKPFPFSDWPELQEDESVAADIESVHSTIIEAPIDKDEPNSSN